MVALSADDSPAPGSPQTAIDTTVSYSARIWNYWLGGKDNYQVDREVGEQILTFVPELVRSARAVRYLAGDEGIRPFEPGVVSCSRWRPDQTDSDPNPPVERRTLSTAEWMIL